MCFHRLKEKDLVEQVHIFGLSNIHTLEPNINLIRLFSPMFNNLNPQRVLKAFNASPTAVYLPLIYSLSGCLLSSHYLGLVEFPSYSK